MLKMHRKPLLIVGLLLSIAGVSLVAYGMIFAISDPVHVDVKYAVKLETLSVVNSVITLKATVTNTGPGLVGPGLIVDFYVSIDGGTSTFFATQLTDAAGLAQTTYTATGNGGYDFKAILTVP